MTPSECLRTPVLLTFDGEDHRRVPFGHGTRLREALGAGGPDPLYAVCYDGGHGWLRRHQRMDLASGVQEFLAEQLR